MNKLKNCRGEILLESLASVLIAALVFAFFATATLVAGRINAQTRATDNSFHYRADAAAEERQVTLTGTAHSATGRVKVYADNGYEYFEPAEEATP